MFAVKRELKLNKVETSLLRGNAGFKRFVYNFGLELLTASWKFADIKASDNRRLDAIKQILTLMMDEPQYQWMRKYPSTVYHISRHLGISKMPSKGGGKAYRDSPIRNPKRKVTRLPSTKHLASIRLLASQPYLLPIESLSIRGRKLNYLD